MGRPTTRRGSAVFRRPGNYPIRRATMQRKRQERYDKYYIPARRELELMKEAGYLPKVPEHMIGVYADDIADWKFHGGPKPMAEKMVEAVYELIENE